MWRAAVQRVQSGADGFAADDRPLYWARLAMIRAVRDCPKPPPTRVSLTTGCLSRAREVWFVVAGADKAEAVAKGVSGAPAQESTAAQLQALGRTLWLVDEAAAAGTLVPLALGVMHWSWGVGFLRSPRRLADGPGV